MKGLLVVGLVAGLGVGGYFLYRKVATPTGSGTGGTRKSGTGAKPGNPPNAPASSSWVSQIPWGQVASAGAKVASEWNSNDTTDLGGSDAPDVSDSSNWDSYE